MPKGGVTLFGAGSVRARDHAWTHPPPLYMSETVVDKKASFLRIFVGNREGWESGFCIVPDEKGFKPFHFDLRIEKTRFFVHR